MHLQCALGVVQACLDAYNARDIETWFPARRGQMLSSTMRARHVHTSRGVASSRSRYTLQHDRQHRLMPGSAHET
jgi:hypothetical protein